jgi:hypothetical protein
MPSSGMWGRVDLVAACHLLTLVPRSRIFYLENGDDTFLRNVDSDKIYTAPHPRRRNSS